MVSPSPLALQNERFGLGWVPRGRMGPMGRDLGGGRAAHQKGGLRVSEVTVAIARVVVYAAHVPSNPEESVRISVGNGTRFWVGKCRGLRGGSASNAKDESSERSANHLVGGS